MISEIKIQKAIDAYRKVMEHENGFKILYNEFILAIDDLQGDDLQEYLERLKYIRGEYVK